MKKIVFWAMWKFLPAVGKTIFNSLVYKVLISGHLCCCQDEWGVCCSILRLVLFNGCRCQKKQKFRRDRVQCLLNSSSVFCLTERLHWKNAHVWKICKFNYSNRFGRQTLDVFSVKLIAFSESYSASSFILITFTSAEITQESVWSVNMWAIRERPSKGTGGSVCSMIYNMTVLNFQNFLYPFPDQLSV